MDNAVLADIIGSPVDRPNMLETTALGVAWLAGMHIGFYPNKENFSSDWVKDRRFEPQMDQDLRNRLIKGWGLAIKRTLLK